MGIVVMKNGFSIVSVHTYDNGLVECIWSLHVRLRDNGESYVGVVDVPMSGDTHINDLPPIEEVTRAMGHFHKKRLVVSVKEFFEAIDKPLPDQSPALKHTVALLGGELYWPCCWIGMVGDFRIHILSEPFIPQPHQIWAAIYKDDHSFVVEKIVVVEHIPYLLELSEIVQRPMQFRGVMEGDVVHGSVKVEDKAITFSTPVEDLGVWLSLMK